MRPGHLSHLASSHKKIFRKIFRRLNPIALFNLCVGFRPQFGGILGIRSGRRVPDGTSQISTAAG